MGERGLSLSGLGLKEQRKPYKWWKSIGIASDGSDHLAAVELLRLALPRGVIT
jgi:hypothetical protein